MVVPNLRRSLLLARLIVIGWGGLVTGGNGKAPANCKLFMQPRLKEPS